ncbi:shikimate kinase [Ranunculus cassubicifolius]
MEVFNCRPTTGFLDSVLLESANIGCRQNLGCFSIFSHSNLLFCSISLRAINSRVSIRPSLFSHTPCWNSMGPLSSGENKEVVGRKTSLAMKNMAAEASSELKGTSIFLVGTKSTIKTKLGNVLADALKYYFFDSDNLVEQATGGESDAKARQDSETEVLRQLSSMGRLVVCTGDGAIESSTNLSLLRHGISVWVDIPPHLLAREAIESGNQSPYSEVLDNVTLVYGKMKDEYAAISDATVSLQKIASQLGYEDVDSVSVDDIALEALKEIEKLTRVKRMMEAAARPF